jgi:hypothetical protein
MRSTCLVFAAGLGLMTAAAALPVRAADADTHIITPHYPDQFKFTTTAVQDQTQETMGKASNRHMQIVLLADVGKAGDGYKGTYTIQSLNLTSTGADNQPSPQAKNDELIKALYGSVGTIQVTLDENMAPVRIDNFDELKSRIHTAMLSSSVNQNGAAEAAFNMIFGNFTAESAAALLNQSQKMTSPFNRPLTLNQPVKITGEPLNFFGASLNLNATMTLEKWDEGKTARIHYVMAPSSEDLHGFMTMLIGAFMHQSPTATDPKTKEMIDRLLANMQMEMTVDCETDIDLANSVNRHNDCHTKVAMRLDMSKVLTEAELKGNPDAAKSLPVITSTQDTHAVSDAVMAQ